MFAYSDAAPSRPTFEQLLDAYFQLLPDYQKVPLEQLGFKRVLFGGFPSYSNGPLQPGFDRVLQLGDASACQSPLSFGGFGSMLRHLSRLSEAISHALREDKLKQKDLALIHPYQPSLAAAWLYQRAMGFKVGQVAPPKPSFSTPLPPPPGPAPAAPTTSEVTPGESAGSSGSPADSRGSGRVMKKHRVTVRLPELVSSALKGSERAVASLALDVAQSSRAAAVAAADLGVQALAAATAAAALVAAKVAGGVSGMEQQPALAGVSASGGSYGNGGARRMASVGRVGAVRNHQGHRQQPHKAGQSTAMYSSSSKNGSSSSSRQQQEYGGGGRAVQVVGRVGRTYRMPDSVASGAGGVSSPSSVTIASGSVGSPVIGVAGVEAATATMTHHHSSPSSSPAAAAAATAAAAARSAHSSQPSSSSSAAVAPAPEPAARSAQSSQPPSSSPSSSAAAATAGATAAAGLPGWAQLPRDHVNQLLACNFGVMSVLGQRVLKPFLQDTIQLLPLAATMGGMMLANPPVICRVLPQVRVRIGGGGGVVSAVTLRWGVGWGWRGRC